MNHDVFSRNVVDFVMIMVFGILVVVKPAIIPFENRMWWHSGENGWG